jgi:hypothetical protein
MMKDCAHDIPNLRSCALCPLDAVQPFFNGYRLDVIESVTPSEEESSRSDSFSYPARVENDLRP